jgi:hypothetical protein
MSDFCTRFSGILLNRTDDAKWLLFRGRCKQWSCDACAQWNKSLWKQHLLKSIGRIGGYWSMVTITASSYSHKKGNTLEAIIKNFDKLSKRLKRAWGKYEYVRVYEKHKSGQFHVHLLVSWIPVDAWDASAYKTAKKGRKSYRGVAYAPLKEDCAQCGLGWCVDIAPIKGDGLEGGNVIFAVSYVVKYLGKQLGVDMPKFTRRIQSSIGVGSANMRSKTDGWELRAGIPIDALANREIYDLSRRKRLDVVDFQHGSYPPILDL